MPTTDCAVCGHIFGDSMTACPKCGEPHEVQAPPINPPALPARAKRHNEFTLKGWFSFRIMLTPDAIRVGYVLGVIFGTLAFLVEPPPPFRDGGFVLNAIAALAFNIVWRIWCEFGILFFSIHDLLVEQNARIAPPRP